MSDYSNLIQAIVEGNYIKCVELTNEALDEGASPQDIVSSGLQAGTLIVGDKFSAGDFLSPICCWQLGQSPELWKLYALVFQIRECLPWDE